VESDQQHPQPTARDDPPTRADRSASPIGRSRGGSNTVPKRPRQWCPPGTPVTWAVRWAGA